MRLRLISLLATTAVATTPLLMVAAPASAAACTAPTLVSTQVSPGTVVLDHGATATVGVRVALQANGCTLSAVSADVTSPSKGSTTLPLTLDSVDGDVTVYVAGFSFDAATLANADAGTWKVRSAAVWQADAGTTALVNTGGESGDDESGDGPGDDESADANVVEGSAKVAVLRASSVTADATSSALTKKNRVKKGKTLTVQGQLSRADWELSSDAGYGKQKVDLQFRTTRGSYKKVRSFPVSRTGTFASAVKAGKDGCYRVVFRGNRSTAAATSAGECIDVR